MRPLVRLIVPLLVAACGHGAEPAPSSPPPSPADPAGDESEPIASGSSANPDAPELEAAAQKLLTEVQTQLQLNDDQMTELRGVWKHHLEQLLPHVNYIRSQDSRRSRFRAYRERRSEISAIQSATDAKVRGIMTPQQFERFLALREEFKAKLKAHMQGTSA